MDTKISNFIREYLLGDKVRKWIPKLIWVILFFEVMTFAADWIQEQCSWEIEEMFNYTMGNVIPVVAIAWGVASIPMAFLLDRIDRGNYGIQMIDFLIACWGMRDLIVVIISFAFQLSFILVAVFHGKIISFTAVAWVQIIYVCLTFYLVALINSREAVRSVIKEQCENIGQYLEKNCNKIVQELKGKRISEQEMIIGNYLKIYSDEMERGHWILRDMIKNLNYKKIEDVENLEGLLRDSVCPRMNGVYGQKMIYDLFEILLSVADTDTVNRITYNVFCGDIGDDARKGILAALFFERSIDSYNQCEILMNKLRDETGSENPIFVKFCYWGILWCNHQRLFITKPDEDLRNHIFIKRLQNLTKCKCIFVTKDVNNLIWYSCLDFMILESVREIDRVIDNLFTCEVIDLFGGINDEK